MYRGHKPSQIRYARWQAGGESKEAKSGMNRSEITWCSAACEPHGEAPPTIPRAGGWTTLQAACGATQQDAANQRSPRFPARLAENYENDSIAGGCYRDTDRFGSIIVTGIDGITPGCAAKHAKGWHP